MAITQLTWLFLLERLYTVSEERKWFQAQQSLLYQAQQSLLYQAQQGLLYQAQQDLPNWPTNYKFAFWDGPLGWKCALHYTLLLNSFLALFSFVYSNKTISDHLHGLILLPARE